MSDPKFTLFITAYRNDDALPAYVDEHQLEGFEFGGLFWVSDPAGENAGVGLDEADAIQHYVSKLPYTR